jgi:arylsulfatase A-like enzyme
LIVFLNDNGGTNSGAHSNGSLRGYKGTYWEGGIRIPYIISWPGRLPQGKRFEHPVSSLDLLPTCLAAAGVTVDSRWEMDGTNLLPYLEGKASGVPHERLFWRMWRASAVREGPWKLIRVAESPLNKSRELLAPLLLINLEDDPGETTNLAEHYPDKARDLLEKIIAWEKPMPQPRWYDGSNWQHWQEEQVKNHQMD